MLEPLLLQTKKEWAELRSSSRNHVNSSANRLSPAANNILKILKDSRVKATSDYAILKARQDMHLATLRNENPTKPRLQDPFRFDTEKAHHIACPNCDHSSVMALEDAADITAKNKAIEDAHTEKMRLWNRRRIGPQPKAPGKYSSQQFGCFCYQQQCNMSATGYNCWMCTMNKGPFNIQIDQRGSNNYVCGCCVCLCQCAGRAPNDSNPCIRGKKLYYESWCRTAHYYY